MSTNPGSVAPAQSAAGTELVPGGRAPAVRVPLAGWGRQLVVDAELVASPDLESVTRGAALSRGLGRAYGDAALPPPGLQRKVVHTVLADRILAFDDATGRIRVEAGLRLHELNRLFLPRRWFTPVTPGTQFVTVGGMVASDVHGKNHHAHGCFSRFVRALRIRFPAEGVLEVGPEREPGLFWATVGGMGLTGHILEVEFELAKVPSPWILEESTRHPDLASSFAALREASARSSMTVSWIDTSARGAAMGRGIVISGRWAEPAEAPPEPPRARTALPVPVDLPSGLMNRASIRLANALWYAKHGAGRRAHCVSPEGFFYQLDMATDWNRVYGRRGFTQYQCVLPSSVELFAELLGRFQALGGCSFVTVLKDCGEEGRGMLSFPKPGTSLALDIPMSADTPRLIGELNALVIANGGRVYLAKDSFTTAAEFRSMYARFPEFDAVRRRVDPHGEMISALSVRLMGDLPRG